MTDGPPDLPAASTAPFPWPDDVAHRLVRAEIERLWRDSCRPGSLRRLVYRLRRRPFPVRPLFIRSFSRADWRTGRLVGQPDATLCYAGNAFVEVEADAIIRERAEEGYPLYHYPLFSFAIAPEGDRVVIERVWGRRMGSGSLLHIVGAPGKERLRFQDA